MALPTAATSKPDSTGRLWGQAKGARCAFKDAAGHALFYTGYEPGSWLHTAACSMPAFSDNSVTDSKLRVSWGRCQGCVEVAGLMPGDVVCLPECSLHVTCLDASSLAGLHDS